MAKQEKDCNLTNFKFFFGVLENCWNLIIVWSVFPLIQSLDNFFHLVFYEDLLYESFSAQF